MISSGIRIDRVRRKLLRARRRVVQVLLTALILASPLSAAFNARSFFEQGVEAYKSGNYGSAELLFRKIIDADDEEYRDPAWFNMALTFFQRGKYEAALFEFRSFLNKCRSEQLLIDSRYWMGECLIRLKQYANAIEEFRRYITKSKDPVLTAQARDRIGDIYFSQQRFDEAIIEWEQALVVTSDRRLRDQRLSRIGEAKFYNGNLDQSLDMLTPLLAPSTERLPLNRARLIAGRIHHLKGNHQRAIQIMSAIPADMLVEMPFADARYFMALSWIALANQNQAISLLDEFVRVAKESPFFYEALFDLGKYAADAGKDQEALVTLDRVRREATNPALRARAVRLAGTINLKEHPERAIRILTEALSIEDQEERKEITILLGKSYLRNRQFAKAGEVFEQFLRDNPHDPRRDEVVFLQGRVCLERGDIEQAIKLFEGLGRDNPFSPYNRESLYYLALVNKAKGNYKQAMAALKDYTAQKEGENRFDAFTLLVDLHIQLNDVDGAGKVMDTMMQLFPVQRGIEMVVGRYANHLADRGRPNQKYLNFINSRYPDSETAMDFAYQQANSNFERKQYAAAVDGYAHYLKGRYSKNRGTAYYRRIIGLYQLRRFSEVTSIIEKGDYPAMTENQWQELPLLHARAYYRQNILDRVYMILEKDNLRSYPPDDVFMYIISAIHVKDLRTAMETAELLEKNRELYAESLFRIGSAYLREKNMNEAELFLTRVINECQGTRSVDHARVALAELRREQRHYKEALVILDEIKDVALAVRTHALMALTLFDLERFDEARELTRKYLQEFATGDQGLPVIRRSLDYAYRRKDIQEFNTFAQILRRYREYEAYLEYLSGMLHYGAGNHQKALYHFGRAEADERYRAESLYYLGMIHLLALGNRNAAMQYLQRVLQLPEKADVLGMKVRIQLAILYREMNNDPQAKQFLNEIITQMPSGMLRIQAMNLAEEYGYIKP